MEEQATKTQEKLAHRIKDERHRRGWSQIELAEKSSLSIAAIQNLENPRPGQASNLRTLMLVLETLGIELRFDDEHQDDYEDVCKVCGQKRGAS